MPENYQKTLDKTLAQLQAAGQVPRLLLHSCCAPCSSYVLEYLSQYFAITVFYYNPNISPESEFRHRVEEQQRLIREMPLIHPVDCLVGDYEPEQFTAISVGHEADPEGGERCTACYRLRLEKTAKAAADGGFDYFTTTLSISPLKDAARLNTIGGELAEKYGVPYLFSDFKKREGYKRSCQLSVQYGLYRQNYCGCAFSRRDAFAKEKTIDTEN
ncbi:MAG: epoxyqueuosine reductase QueH [Clostridia bacterium]|nr:epoxyqueuosine reductase QueH [Clostridia bacterium]